MRLSGALDLFLGDVAALAARFKAFALPDLAVTQVGRFLALCLGEPCAQIHALADACVVELDAHRMEEDAAMRAKRAAGCSARQLANLARWGYPFVREDFLFHMTLSNGLEQNYLAPVAERYFGGTVRAPRRAGSIAVFAEPAPGAAFCVLQRFGLEG